MMDLLKIPEMDSKPSIKSKFQTFKHAVLDELIDELDCQPDYKSKESTRNLLLNNNSTKVSSTENINPPAQQQEEGQP